MPRQFYVYILANRSRTLYVGVTNDIVRRVLHHRAGVGSRFTDRYAITRLVHVEITNIPRDAIAREKQIKGWSRAKKVTLIETANPTWTDLAEDWFENEVDLCREVRDSFRRH
jgi:putative endonuclease